MTKTPILALTRPHTNRSSGLSPAGVAGQNMRLLVITGGGERAYATLETLATRYCLGVITNGNADIRRLGLADYFRFAVSAEQLGIGKPDPRPFQEALRLAGISANQAVHIGDHPLDDIAGARQAGLQAIWFNPQGQPWQASTAPPTAQVRRLAELPGLLRGGLSRQ